MTDLPLARWEQIDRLFAEALDQPPSEREEFLRSAAGGDEELRDEVLTLLRNLTEAGDRVDRIARDVSDLASSIDPGTSGDGGGSRAGERVGPFTIVSEIGRGGMGAVYLAERAEGDFPQRVAIKLVKRGMDTDEVLRRFRQERRILASLEHRNIARLLDGGATEDGHPYLAMELVDGEPVTHYCDRVRLPLDERLALFITICRAVQHAHQNLVVHRDLKPSNILVVAGADGAPEPKLLDFGIAKLLGADEPDSGARTRTGLRVLTPDYASPEQLAGDAVGTASDVWQLGILLFELLTGSRPFERSNPSDPSTAHREARRPSTVVTTRRREHSAEADAPDAIAAGRRTTPERLRRRLRGDLDTIVLKALERDPHRRYGSVQQLLDDVQRHLDGRPVHARPAGLVYRGRKFIRRHSTVAAAVAALLVMAATFALLHSTRITRERDIARAEAEKAQATLAFLQELFEQADPNRLQGDTLTIFQLLDLGAERLERGGMEEQPLVRASVHHTLGALYLRLGAFGESRSHLERSLATRAGLLGSAHPDVARTTGALGELFQASGEYDRADTAFAAAVATARRAGLPTLAATLLNSWGYMLAYAGRYDEAERRLLEARELLDRTPGDHRVERVRGTFAMGTIRFRQGEYDLAEPLFREAFDAYREVHGELNTHTIDALNNLGNVLVEKRRYDEAIPVLTRTLEARRQLLGPMHPDVSLSLNNLAVAYVGKRDFTAADSMLRASLAIKEAQVGPDHRDVGLTRSNIGFVLMEAGRLDQAEHDMRAALAVMQKASGPVSPDAGLVLGNLARILQRQRRYAEAESLYREALAVRMTVHGERSMHVAWRLTALAELLRETRRYAESEALHRQSLAIRRELQGDAHPETARGLSNLGRVLLDQRRFVDAESLLVAGYDVLTREESPPRPLLEEVMRNLEELYRGVGRADRADEFAALLAGAR